MSLSMADQNRLTRHGCPIAECTTCSEHQLLWQPLVDDGFDEAAMRVFTAWFWAGTNISRLTAFTGMSPDTVRTVYDRLRGGSIWRRGGYLRVVRADEPDGKLASLLDALVAEGTLVVGYPLGVPPSERTYRLAGGGVMT